MRVLRSWKNCKRDMKSTMFFHLKKKNLPSVADISSTAILWRGSREPIIAFIE